jgi:DNA-binding MarR family transcriptional regulator
VAANRSVKRRAAGAGGPEMSYLVGRLNRALRRRLTEALRPHELSLAQYTTMSVLSTRGQLSNSQLASRAFISPQAMNEVVQGLETRKLIMRQPSASHGRIVEFLLTEQGIEAKKSCDARVAKLEKSMLAQLTGAEAASLKAALIKCAQTLETSETRRSS